MTLHDPTHAPGRALARCVTLAALLTLALSTAWALRSGSALAALAGSCCLVGLTVSVFNRRGRTAAFQTNEADRARLNTLVDANEQTLRAGSEGELAVDNAVRSILREMAVPFWLPQLSGVDAIVMLPREPGQISREIDCLVVCPFGVYVLEVKHWAMSVGVHEDPQLLRLLDSSGKVQPARSAPLRKTMSKSQALCLHLPRHVPWRALVVFSHPDGSIHPQLPADYVSMQDLGYFFRQERDRARVTIDPQQIGQMLLGQLDRRVDAKHWHMMALPALNRDGSANPDIAQYQHNDQEIKRLQNKPPVCFTPRYRARWWLLAGGLFLAATGWTDWQALRAQASTLTARQAAREVAVAPDLKAATRPVKPATKLPRRRPAPV